MLKIATFVAVIWASLAGIAFAQAAKISPITNEIYRYQSGELQGLVILTSDGVVVVDPLNNASAAWLNTELRSLIGRPVTHVIYSHGDIRHSSGGAAFVDATSIAHTNAPASMGGVSPTIRFKDKMVMDLGSKQIEMTAIGPGAGRDLIAIVVQPDRIAFVGQGISPKHLPEPNFARTDPSEWIDVVDRLSALNFSTLIGSRGQIGDKSDLYAFQNYIRTLQGAVLGGLRAGDSQERLIELLKFDGYGDWRSGEGAHVRNIMSMAKFLMLSGKVK
jgi:glyoxylase-like metal-dependent hydrolase (beta-lactamase superfamily II)